MNDPALPLILRSWSWQPGIMLGLVVVGLSYAYAFYDLRRRGRLAILVRRGAIKRRQPWYFAAGLATLVVALLSPIDTLSDMLFFAHMVQHVLLIMIAPPLILLGLPAPVIRLGVQEFRLREILEWLTNPFVAYVLFNANLLLWHVPAAYEAALFNDVIHDLEHALFFYTAVLFWWRIIDPTDGWFPLWQWQPARWLYLILAAPPSYFLGSILWASDSVFYPFYTRVPRLWGLSPLADQQYGGLIMWIQGWMYVMISVGLLFAWYEPETEQV